MPKSDLSENQGKKVKKDKSKNKKPKLIILIALILLAGSSAGAYFYFNKPADAMTAIKKASTAKTVTMETVDMGEMVVNLSGNGGGALPPGEGYAGVPQK